MSEQPQTGRSPRGADGGNVFTHRIGPLPMWAWVAIVGGLLVAYRLYSNKASGSQASTASSTTDQTAANQVPQFVNQTYVSTTAPGTPAATPPAGTTGGTPTNPSPVSTVPSTQPKPTTTSAGSWTYPAPGGLQAYDVASTGVRLSWNAVTGPSGQHPNSYTVATYNSNGKLVDQFDTTAGNTNTAEYGKGGKGLPKGVYHTNVWANGGPVAPPHATVQYTLKG